MLDILNPLHWLKTFLNWIIKLKPRHLLALSFVCFVILILPKSWKRYLGYEELIQPHQGLISLIGLSAGVYGFALIVAGVKDFIFIKLSRWYSIRKAPKILRDLSSQEKSYVAKYIKQNVSTLKFNITDGVICGLELKGVVYKAPYVYSRNCDFNLKPWVIKSLEKHTDLKDDILKHYEEKRKIL